jgi:putative ABC transport system permease protein
VTGRDPLWRRYLRFFGADPRADVDDELRFHVEELERQFVAGGMSAQAARRAAKEQFGNLERTRADLSHRSARSQRRANRTEWWRRTVDGARLGVRRLLRTPTFTVTTVLTLALGMGATTAIYTLVQRVVLDPLPYPHADRLVRLKNPFPAVGPNVQWELSTAQYFYYAKHAPDLAAIGLYGQNGANFEATGTPRRVTVAGVTASALGLLGARAIIGRLIDAKDDAPGAPLVAVLSRDFWRREFGGDSTVVGRTITLNDQPVQIVGVMAAGVELPAERGQAVDAPSDVWVPSQLNPSGPFYNSHIYPAIARLADGVTADHAQAQLLTLAPQLVTAFPSVYHSMSFFDQSKGGMYTAVYPLKAYVLGDMARDLWIVFAGIGFVLVIAGANVVNLLLVRLESRRREFAIRAALGAGRRQFASQTFAEGILLSSSAAALGVLVAYGGTAWLAWLQPSGLPRVRDVQVDGRTWAFAAILAVAVAGLMAIVPLAHAASPQAMNALGDGGRSGTAGRERHRLRGSLVVAQVALACVLAVSSALLLRTFAALRAVNPGVDASGVLTLQLYLPPQRYDSAYKTWQFIARSENAIRRLPGVTAVGLGDELPFVSDYGCTVQGFEDRAVYGRLQEMKQTTCAGQGNASPGYFAALGIPVLAGRVFDAADNDGPERGTVVVSKTFADRFWPGENPIGKGVGNNGNERPPFYHVIGVVGDVHTMSVTTPPANAVYYPIVPIPSTGDQWYDNGFFLVVRTSRGDPLSYLPAVRAAVAHIDPNIPIADAATMTSIVAGSMSRVTFTMTLLGIAGLTALLLAAVGLYGVISYIVARRTSEIGVRLALGAQPGQVERLVVRGALGLTAAGLVLGAAGAYAFSRLLSSLLYGVTPRDPVSYVTAVFTLGIVATAAAWIPARRAAAVDPATALRTD